MKLNYEEILFYQEYWKRRKEIPEEQKNKLVDLSNKLIERAKSNQDELNGVVLLYPEDCTDYKVFTDFAFVMLAYVRKRQDNGLKMEGWGLNHELDVE